MDATRPPYALGAEDGEWFWGFGALWTIKASAEQTGGRFSLIEEFAPGGEGTPLHVHREDDETFYILEGELTFYLNEGQHTPASAGSFVHIPGGVIHAFKVDSETARYLIITTAQHGHEHFHQKNRLTWKRSRPQRKSTRSRYSAPHRALGSRDGCSLYSRGFSSSLRRGRDSPPTTSPRALSFREHAPQETEFPRTPLLGN